MGIPVGYWRVRGEESGRFGPGLPCSPLLPSPRGSGRRRSSWGSPGSSLLRGGTQRLKLPVISLLILVLFFWLLSVGWPSPGLSCRLRVTRRVPTPPSPVLLLLLSPGRRFVLRCFFPPLCFFLCVCVCVCVLFPSTHPPLFCCFVVPFLLCYSLESAKPSSQAASVAIPDHLSINLSQPSTPSSSSSSTTTPSLATAGAADAPASLPNPLPSAPCVSSLLGMKPVPLLALNVVAAAKGSSAPALPSATNKLKAEKQRFSPY